MNRRMFFGLLPALGALFGLKAKASGAKLNAGTDLGSRMGDWTVLDTGADVYVSERLAAAWELSDLEYAADMAFYGGDQWDPQVRAKRLAMGRPCLVINQIPLLVQAHITKPTSGDDYARLVHETILNYRDQQVMLNYFYSNLVEAQRFKR